MPSEPVRYVDPDDVPETVLLRNLALITAGRNASVAYWVAADEQGASDGTYMIVCVLGPKYIADLQVAMQEVMKKWDEDETAAGEEEG